MGVSPTQWGGPTLLSCTAILKSFIKFDTHKGLHTFIVPYKRNTQPFPVLV